LHVIGGNTVLLSENSSDYFVGDSSLVWLGVTTLLNRKEEDIQEIWRK